MRTKIYALCGNGIIRYIGKTTRSLNIRLTAHLSDVRIGRPDHKCNWIRSLLREGKLPNIQLIGEVEGDGSAEEIAWIKYFRDEGVALVNSTDGGDGMSFGYVPSQESREKVRAALKGRKRSESICLKISIGKKGKKFSELHKQHMSNSLRKSPIFQKRLELLHQSLKGLRHSAESCQRQSVAVKEKMRNPAERLQRSLALIGRQKTPEICAKISAAKKEYWRRTKESRIV